MDNHSEQTSNPEKNGNEFLVQSGFTTAIKFLLFSCFLGIMTQNFYDKTSSFDEYNLLGIGVTAGVFLIFGTIWGRKVFRVIDTPYFAISAILLIALATAAGTFVGQNMPPEAFQFRYGQTLSKIFTFLKMNDVFHSWWYVILFLLLTISLVKISLKRQFSLANMGFHLAHLGPAIVLFGFWWDYYAGYRGLMQLVSGKSTDLVSVYHRNTNRIKDTINLDFQLKLDYFRSERFEPDHRVHIWENQPGVNGNVDSRIVASLPVEIDKKRKIYNTDIEFEVKEFYPNFYLEYSYPEDTDTIEAKNPGILFELINPHGSNVMQLRANNPRQYRFDDPILGVAFEFYWTLPVDVRSNIQNFDPNSNWSKKPRVIFCGEENTKYVVSQGNLEKNVISLEEEYQVPGKSKSGYKVIFIFPDAAKLISQPATRNQSQQNPVARLEVRRGKEEPDEAFIYPQEKGQGGQFVIPGTNYLLALESMRDKETKFWESGLSILNSDGEIVKQKEILVNEPLFYNGFRFYQSDYDPNNPNYSGIGVSYTPGLTLIYFGFYVLIGGVLVLFYLRSRISEVDGLPS